MSSKPNQASKPVGIKETLTSLTIAFMLAFVFRGFVIEGFIIPTGSMAPTLLGKHVRFESPYSGYSWTTGPWDRVRIGGNTDPLPKQGGQPRGGGSNTPPLTPTDPMTGIELSGQTDRRLAAGDRVFVLKYLPGLHQPERWDVVVFKNPSTHENYIKRLIALPGEQLALVDGDVFYRQFESGKTAESGPDAWRENSWSIARKDERTQRTMMLPVFDSRYSPITPEPSYRPPFSPDNVGAWSGVETSNTWSYTGTGPTQLFWNNRRPITDSYAYNQDNPGIKLDANPGDPNIRLRRPYPVSDISVSVAVEPGSDSLTVSPVIQARGFIFEGVIDAASGTAGVRMRPDDQPESWTVLDSAEYTKLSSGRVTEVEFWHVDQALWLFVDGKLICGGPEAGAYQLSPAQRIAASMVPTYDELVANDTTGNGISSPGVFARTDLYRNARPRIEFSGGPLTVHRVRVNRDIFYQPAPVGDTRATRGAHFDNFPTLSGDQYFMCGDNSPNSLDSRYWRNSQINPWVRSLIDPTPGVVNRDLIVGQAFVVYFPAPLDGGPILSPDVGRVRWIW